MPRSISIPDDLHKRLSELAAFARCDMSEVIERLLRSLVAQSSYERIPASEIRSSGESLIANSRVARERGITVMLEEKPIEADSVRDLSEKVLRHIVESGKKSELLALLPYKTSSHRYLIAEKPKHPNGNPFFVPTSYDGLWIETHKSYHTAISQLGDLLSKLKIHFRYVP